MPIEPRKWTYFSQINAGLYSPEFINQISAVVSAYQIDAIKVTVEEIVDWDTSKMRAFFHAIVLPAFTAKISTAYPPTEGGYTRKLIKRFLKARFLGFIEDESFVKWSKVIDLEKHKFDILEFIELQKIMSSLKDPPTIIHTEDITPHGYWAFLNECEQYYHETFHDMYSKRSMPEKPLA